VPDHEIIASIDYLNATIKRLEMTELRVRLIVIAILEWVNHAPRGCQFASRQVATV